MTKSSHGTVYVAMFIVFLVLSLPSLGLAVWALYDGTVYYPELVERWDAYQQVMLDHPQNYRQEWPTVASQNGWPTEIPQERTEHDIVTQYVMMGFCGISGFVFVATAVVFALLWRRLEAKD